MSDFFSRPIVCNTGPVIALSRCDLGHLLSAIFPRVVITDVVLAELTAKDAGDLSGIQKTLVGIEIVHTSEPDPLLTTELDAGEASVIQAARDLPFASVLIDERRARRIAAEAYGLEVHGTCALLVEAKRRSLVARLKPAIETMIEGGYFIGPKLMAECLRQVGE